MTVVGILLQVIGLTRAPAKFDELVKKTSNQEYLVDNGRCKLLECYYQ